jgi:phospholipid transport system substrate-binding protein
MLRRLLASLIVITVMPVSALAAGQEDARQFVDGLAAKVIALVNDKGAESQREQQLQGLFVDYVDIDWMAKFVLGQGWQSATEEQRTRYLDAYKRYLLARYTGNFGEYSGSKYTITNVKDDGDGQFTVAMKIDTPKYENTQAGYRLRHDGSQYKVIDIIIEGVSLITTQRAEFAGTLQKGGMDGLIASLGEKTSTMAAK